MVEQVPDSDFRLFGRTLVFIQSGARRSADSAMAVFIDRYHASAAYSIAVLYACRGEADSAFAWLERAYALRDQGLAEVKVDMLLQHIRGDPRYRAFLTKMRLTS
jgi:hypothetical protein